MEGDGGGDTHTCSALLNCPWMMYILPMWPRDRAMMALLFLQGAQHFRPRTEQGTTGALLSFSYQLTNLSTNQLDIRG